jgi:hypothetical protein
MAINVKSVWLGMKLVAPAIKARGGGAIVNTAIERLFRVGRQRAHCSEDPRVVEEGIDPAPACGGGGDVPLHVGRPRDVRLHCERRTAGPLDGRHALRERSGRHVDEHDARALGGEAHGRRAPDPAATGNDDDPVLKAH